MKFYPIRIGYQFNLLIVIWCTNYVFNVDLAGNRNYFVNLTNTNSWNEQIIQSMSTDFPIYIHYSCIRTWTRYHFDHFTESYDFCSQMQSRAIKQFIRCKWIKTNINIHMQIWMILPKLASVYSSDFRYKCLGQWV